MRRALFLFVVVAFSPRNAATLSGPLGPEFRVNTQTLGDQRSPAVATDAAGNFVLVWPSQGQDGSDYGIFGQRYASSGTPVGPEFRVNTFTLNSQFAPSVAADSSGNFVVMWQSYLQDGSGAGVFGQRYASSGAPLGPEFRANTFTTNNQGGVSVASDPAGNFVVAWISSIQDGIFGPRYASTGAPLGPEFRVNTFTESDQDRVDVASDTAGAFVVVWQSWYQDGAGWGLFAQRYDSSGAPLGPEFRVNTYTPDDQRFPAVTSDSSGNFVVVWSSDQQDGSSRGVFGQRYASSGAPIGPEFRATTYTTNHQDYPAVASDSSGNFVVVWDSDQDGGGYRGIFGQRYADSGAPIGPEFRANTYTTNTQRFPVVASDSSGNFVVAWQSDLQDGSNYGVFGQRYRMIVPVELMHLRVE